MFKGQHCNASAAAAAAAPGRGPPTPRRLAARPRQSQFSVSISAGDFDCIAEPGKTVDVRAASEGLIDNIWVDRGDTVKAGQVLVTLDSGVERAATEAARYRSTMEGRVRTGESRVEFSTDKYNRREKLAGQSFISLRRTPPDARQVPSTGIEPVSHA